MIENIIFHDKSKHIEIKYHFIWDMVYKGGVKLKYVPIEEQVANVLTKPLAHVKFEYFWEKLGLVRNDVSQKTVWQQMLEAMVSRSV